jgi:hypothetical protein
MAKKKKRRRPPATSPGASRSASSPGSTAPASVRRERKEAARLRREKQAKAAVRRGALRRAAIGGVAGVVVFAAITWYTHRAPGWTPLSQPTIDAALAGGCDDMIQPDPAPVRTHLEPGQSYGYPQHPATSGAHDPSTLPGQPRVYSDADLATYRETLAVHSLEHGSVIMYYRPSADPQGLSQQVVDALGPIATNSRATYLIPYPGLTSGTALAFTAWNRLLTCPAKITADQATTVATGFIQSFACTNNAPEGYAGDGC